MDRQAGILRVQLAGKLLQVRAEPLDVLALGVDESVTFIGELPGHMVVDGFRPETLADSGHQLMLGPVVEPRPQLEKILEPEQRQRVLLAGLAAGKQTFPGGLGERQRAGKAVFPPGDGFLLHAE